MQNLSLDTHIYAAILKLSAALSRLERAEKVFDGFSRAKKNSQAFNLRQYARGEIKYLSSESPELFAKLFFWKNLVKCSIFFEYIRNNVDLDRPIWDIGTGPGTFLIPYLIQSNQFSISPYAVDNNKKSLSIFKKLAYELKLPTPKTFLFDAATSFDSIPECIVLSSYMYVELSKVQKSKFLKSIISNEQTDYFILDYIENIQEIANILNGRRECRYQHCKYFITDPNLSRLVDDDEISFGAIHVLSKD